MALDIETFPNLAHVWGLWDQNVSLDQLVCEGEMFCFAAGWLGESKIHFFSAHHHGKEQMIESAWELLNQADAVLHYNGKRFDIPHMQRLFVEAGMTPPAPFKQIDLLDTVRREFKFSSNKLAHVSVKLGFDGKVKHDGFKLWTACMNGDDAAWKRMKRYNIQDVKLLKDMYEILRPWIKTHPHVGLYDQTSGCPKCGSSNLESRGYAALRTGRYRRLHCLDCGSWSRETKRVDGVDLVEA